MVQDPKNKSFFVKIASNEHAVKYYKLLFSKLKHTNTFYHFSQGTSLAKQWGLPLSQKGPLAPSLEQFGGS